MRVTMTVNGELATADDVWEGESLLFVLRERLALPGSKNACEQGECGSCTVLLDDVPVCACLVAAGQAADREVVTVEGLAGQRRPVARGGPEGLHPVQQAFIDAGAVQCGFCTPGLIMREMGELARGLGVRMHTHLAETREEDAYCRQTLGRTPAEYADELGWLGEDVWLAHCVHLDEPAVKRFAVTGTSVAHCPTSNARLGAGIAPVRQLLRAGATVGLGVDGAASSEGTSLAGEMHQALLAARLKDGHGPAALTARQALWMGTRGGASCLGRADEIGALRPDLQADIALWRMDTLAHDAMAHGADGQQDGDPVAALVFGPPAPIELLLVGGRPVVERGELRTADVTAAVREVRAARLLLGASR